MCTLTTVTKQDLMFKDWKWRLLPMRWFPLVVRTYLNLVCSCRGHRWCSCSARAARFRTRTDPSYTCSHLSRDSESEVWRESEALEWSETCFQALLQQTKKQIQDVYFIYDYSDSTILQYRSRFSLISSKAGINELPDHTDLICIQVPQKDLVFFLLQVIRLTYTHLASWVLLWLSGLWHLLYSHPCARQSGLPSACWDCRWSAEWFYLSAYTKHRGNTIKTRFYTALLYRNGIIQPITVSPNYCQHQRVCRLSFIFLKLCITLTPLLCLNSTFRPTQQCEHVVQLINTATCRVCINNCLVMSVKKSKDQQSTEIGSGCENDRRLYPSNRIQTSVSELFIKKTKPQTCLNLSKTGVFKRFATRVWLFQPGWLFESMQ